MGRRKGIDRKDSLFPFCVEKDVEDENHFLFSCVRYNMVRVRFPVYSRPRLTNNNEYSLKLLSDFVYDMFEK